MKCVRYIVYGMGFIEYILGWITTKGNVELGTLVSKHRYQKKQHHQNVSLVVKQMVLL